LLAVLLLFSAPAANFCENAALPTLPANTQWADIGFCRDATAMTPAQIEYFVAECLPGFVSSGAGLGSACQYVSSNAPEWTIVGALACTGDYLLQQLLHSWSVGRFH
jgi:hypothetical protein